VTEYAPIDSDIDLHDSRQRTELRNHPVTVLGAISLGGALGALARYALGVAFPVATHGFPWTTFAINVTGCLLIGVLMVLVASVWPDQVLVRPFVGVGILGGFTTFSTYVVDIQRLLDHRVPVTALAYLVVTVLSALLATWAGLRLGRAVFG
jgi:fluoride exporter